MTDIWHVYWTQTFHKHVECRSWLIRYFEPNHFAIWAEPQVPVLLWEKRPCHLSAPTVYADVPEGLCQTSTCAGKQECLVLMPICCPAVLPHWFSTLLRLWEVVIWEPSSAILIWFIKCFSACSWGAGGGINKAWREKRHQEGSSTHKKANSTQQQTWYRSAVYSSLSSMLCCQPWNFEYKYERNKTGQKKITVGKRIEKT